MNENFLNPAFKDAECARVENQDVADAFFSEEPGEWAAAKGLCAVCPVRQLCLEIALAEKQVHGVWGGLDEEELRAVQGLDEDGNERVRTRPFNCPNCAGAPEGLALSTRAATGGWASARWVSCGACGFEWSARSGYESLHRWRTSQGLEVENVTIERSIRAPRAAEPVAPQALNIGADVREKGYYAKRAYECGAEGCEEPGFRNGSMCQQHMGSMKVAAKCSVDECNETAIAKRLCSKHYYQNRRNATPRPPKAPSVRRRRRDYGTVGCTAEGCLKKHYSKGLCATHYERARYVARPRVLVYETNADGTCAEQDCVKEAFTRGLCSAHYQRLNRLERKARS